MIIIKYYYPKWDGHRLICIHVFSFRTACNYVGAIDGEKVLEKGKKEVYDLFLIDIELPGMCGSETTK